MACSPYAQKSCGYPDLAQPQDGEAEGFVRLARPETNSFESDIRNTFEAEMNAHLVKPLDADGLYNALKHYIQEAQTEREV